VVGVGGDYICITLFYITKQHILITDENGGQKKVKILSPSQIQPIILEP
jgi:hypothetical protein